MPDVVFKPEFDDSEIRKALAGLEKTTRVVEDEVQKVGDSYSRAFKKAGAAANEYDEILKEVVGTTGKVETAMEQAAKATDDTAKSSNKAGDTIESMARRVNVLGVNLGDLIGKLRAKKGALDDSSASAGGLNKALGILKSVGIAGIIAAVAAALALFVKFGSNISDTQRKIQHLKDEIQGWKAAMVPAIETAALFTKGLGQLIALNYGGAAATWAEAQKKWKEEVLATKNEIADLQTVIRALDKMELGARVQNADLQQRIDLQKAIAADAEKSDGRRLSALREYEKLQGEVLRRELGIAQAALKLQETNRRGKVTEEYVAALERARAAETELAALARDTEAQRRDIVNKRLEEEQKRRLEEQKRIREALEAYGVLVNKLGDQTDKALLSRLYDPEKLLLEREQAVKEVAQFIADLKAAAQRAGVELPATFEQDFKVILNAIDEEFRRGLGELTAKSQREFDKRARDFAKTALESGLNAFAKAQEEAALSVFDRLSQKLLGSLNLTPDQANFLLQQFSSVFSAISQLWSESVNAQLGEQARLIEASQERVKVLQEEVDKERSIKEQGLANNLAGAEAAIKKEESIIEAAQKRAADIQRKAANQQLIINSLLQASELTVAASKIINANAGIPVAGPVIAAAAIALIFSIIAGAKANAARFAQAPKLRKGAKLEGPSHEQGGIPLVVDGAKYYEAEGGEWLIGSAQSKRHDPFLQNLNTGRYNNLDLHALAEQARQHPISSAIKEVKATERRLQTLTKKQELAIMQAAYKMAAEEAAEKMIEYWKTRPIDTPLDSPIRRERVVGRKKVVEIIKPE